MKRHPKLIPLSRFHRSILFLALNAKRNAPAVKGYPTDTGEKVGYALSFYEKQLIPHFELEAVRLFKMIRGKDAELDELLVEFLNEREQLIQLFDDLRKSTNLEEDLHALGFALEKHIRKEERIVFQKIQEVLSEEDLDSLELG